VWYRPIVTYIRRWGSVKPKSNTIKYAIKCLKDRLQPQNYCCPKGEIHFILRIAMHVYIVFVPNLVTCTKYLLSDGRGKKLRQKISLIIPFEPPVKFKTGLCESLYKTSHLSSIYWATMCHMWLIKPNDAILFTDIMFDPWNAGQFTACTHHKNLHSAGSDLPRWCDYISGRDRRLAHAQWTLSPAATRRTACSSSAIQFWPPTDIARQYREFIFKLQR